MSESRYLARHGAVHGRPPRWGPALYPRLAAEVPLSFTCRLPRSLTAGRQER